MMKIILKPLAGQGSQIFVTKTRDSLLDHLSRTTGRGFGRSMLTFLLATRGRNTPKLKTKMGKYIQN
jgi:hypothetical protein